MPKKHIIISGTGRAGTTFLVQLLTALGLDTGFTDTTQNIFEHCNAGMELDLNEPNAPYIVKSPWLCDSLDQTLSQTNDIVIEHAIIPIRDLYSAAQSRIDVTAKVKHQNYQSASIPGGLWHTHKPEQQEQILTHQLYKLIYSLTKHNIPITLLLFPRIVQDPDYLYEKISFLLNNISSKEFKQIFMKVSRPELVHNFDNRDNLNIDLMNGKTNKKIGAILPSEPKQKLKKLMNSLLLALGMK